MDNAKIRLVKSWLTKADHDLGSAKILLEQTPPYLDTAIYHCQQAAEKALKAFLTHNDISFEKTHNLSSLLALCESIHPNCRDYYEEAETLTPYATAFRYPSEFFEEELEVEQVDQALDYATKVYEFVKTNLPPETHPLRSG